MKQGWELKHLGDVCQVQRGLTYSGRDTVDYSNTAVLRATNIILESSSLVFDELKYLRDDFEIKEIYKLRKGSLLICFSSGSKSHLGKVALIKKDYNYAFGGFIGQITPTNDILSRYLFYSLISEKYKKYISELTDGVNINNLKIRDLQAFPLYLPPLPEQKRIVTKLDQCFEAIDKAKANIERNIQNAKDLFQSKLNEIFSQKGEGWIEKKLGEVSILKGRIGWRGLTAKEYTETGPLFISVHSLNYGDFVDFRDAFHISEARYDESPEIMLEKGDVLICKDGAGIGKIGIVKELPGKATVNSSLLVIRRKNTITTKYLYYSLLSPYFQKIVQNRLQGATTPHLYQRDITTFPIFLPSIKEQNTITRDIDFVNEYHLKLISNYQLELSALDEIKKSILDKAFKGELT